MIDHYRFIDNNILNICFIQIKYIVIWYVTCISVDHRASRDEETSHESQDGSELEALIDADLVPIVAQTIGSVLREKP